MDYFENEERKPLCECSDAEILCIIRADMAAEIYPTFGKTWLKREWPVFASNNIYRVPKPIIPDVYPWDDLHPRFVWCARSSGGMAVGSEQKLDRNCWGWQTTEGEVVNLSAFARYKPGNGPWQESLQRRPGS